MSSVITQFRKMLRMHEWVPPRRVGDRCYSYELIIARLGIEVPALLVIRLLASVAGLLSKGVQAFLAILSFFTALVLFSWVGAYIHEYLHARELHRCGARVRIVYDRSSDLRV